MFKKYKLSGRPREGIMKQRSKKQAKRRKKKGWILRQNVIETNSAYENLKSLNWLTRRLIINFNGKYSSPYERINPKVNVNNVFNVLQSIIYLSEL